LRKILQVPAAQQRPRFRPFNVQTEASTAAVPALPAVGALPRKQTARVQSVDLVRGLAMVLMALDHVRYFVTDQDFPPEDLAHTTIPLFFTRWLTHPCAPAFFLLAGTGAMLSRIAGRSTSEVSRFLCTRGLLLVALELTVVGFAWQFSPGYSFAGVIWCLGLSMLLLAAGVRIAGPATLGVIGLCMIALHDLVDPIQSRELGRLGSLWSLLHQAGTIHLGGVEWFVLFPLVPWVGVMALGYWLGVLYGREDPGRRLRLLTRLGVVSFLLFVLLRVGNLYGNPLSIGSGGAREPFAVRSSVGLTAISLLDVEKYPPSLQYLLMTLGPVLLLLAAGERWTPPWTHPLVVFGRVPLFFYLLHLYLIHLVAFGLAVASKQPWHWLGWRGAPIESRAGYGQGLLVVYLLWIAVVALLYPVCRWYMDLKGRSRSTWLRLI